MYIALSYYTIYVCVHTVSYRMYVYVLYMTQLYTAPPKDVPQSLEGGRQDFAEVNIVAMVHEVVGEEETPLV